MDRAAVEELLARPRLPKLTAPQWKWLGLVAADKRCYFTVTEYSRGYQEFPRLSGLLHEPHCPTCGNEIRTPVRWQVVHSLAEGGLLTLEMGAYRINAIGRACLSNYRSALAANAGEKP